MLLETEAVTIGMAWDDSLKLAQSEKGEDKEWVYGRY